MDQLNRFSQLEPPPKPGVIRHPSVSVPFLWSGEASATSTADHHPVKISADTPSVQALDFESSFLDDVADLLQSDDPHSKSPSIPSPGGDIPDLMPMSILPADHPYFTPVENYVTMDHIRMATDLLNKIGVPFVFAPQEAAAECARLEKAGLVDATASDDNNASLVGSKWLIRGLVGKPQSITMRSLEAIGVTSRRLLMVAMMIDGDYNADIRRRLFTVGPVRGLQIVAHFPHEERGLLEFKEWWIRVVKGGGQETNVNRKLLANRRWLKRLLIPADFPPEDLLGALRDPVVGSEAPKVGLVKFNEEEVVALVSGTSSMRPDKIREYCREFAKRASGFVAKKIELMKYAVNPLIEVPAFAVYLGMIERFAREERGEAVEAEVPVAALEEEDVSDGIGSDSVGSEDE
jgi:hypothetical protein